MKKRASIDAVNWFYADSIKARNDEPRIEPRAPGWFLVYGDPRGPIGVFGAEKAEAKLAEIKGTKNMAKNHRTRMRPPHTASAAMLKRLAKYADRQGLVPFDEDAPAHLYGFDDAAIADGRWARFVDEARHLLLKADGFVEVQPRGW